MEHISNYELYGNMGYTKAKPFLCFEKIVIFLILVFIIELLYLIGVLNVLSNKTKQFNELNYRKYELNTKNEKLNQEYCQAVEKNYLFDDEIEEKNDKIKVLDKYIYNYTQLSKEFLKSPLSDNKMYIKIKEKNEKKSKIIDNLKLMKDKEKKDITEKIDSKIIDKESELNNILNLIMKVNEQNNPFKLCYRADNNNLNFEDAYQKCKLRENNNSFMILYQTNLYERYGAFISKNKERSTFVFAIYPNGVLYRINIEELDSNRRQSLIYIINLIKQIKYNNNENSLYSKLVINDLEIFWF
jgi:hypothetical protein